MHSVSQASGVREAFLCSIAKVLEGLLSTHNTARYGGKWILRDISKQGFLIEVSQAMPGYGTTWHNSYQLFSIFQYSAEYFWIIWIEPPNLLDSSYTCSTAVLLDFSEPSTLYRLVGCNMVQPSQHFSTQTITSQTDRTNAHSVPLRNLAWVV